MDCKLAFILVIFTVLQSNACVGSLSSTTVSKNTGYSWIEFSHNQIISHISVTNQCFGYISYNYINYLEQRNCSPPLLDLEEHPMPNKTSHSIAYIFTSWCAFTFVMLYFTRKISFSFSCCLEFMLLNKTVGLSLYSETHADTKGILKLEKLSQFIWILQLVQ